MELNEDWTVEVVARMHKYRIRSVELADACGFTAPYLSTLLNSKKSFESPEAKERTKKKIFSALDRIENEAYGRRF